MLLYRWNNKARQQGAQIREGREQKTDMSKMRANKEEIDRRGDDYAANENDYYDPTPVKQEPVKVGPRLGETIPVLVEAERSIKIATGKMLRNVVR